MRQVIIVVKKNITNTEISSLIAEIEQMFAVRLPHKKPNGTTLTISGDMHPDSILNMRRRFCINNDVDVIKPDFAEQLFEITVH